MSVSKPETPRTAYRTAAVEHVQGNTGILRMSQLPAESVAALAPRPDLSGLRVKLPNQPEIYLIDPEGYRRWVPDPYTYNLLFRDWSGIVVDININEIPDGGPLSHGATLLRADGTAPVYVVSNGVKRWVLSPALMDKYNFNWPSGSTVVPPGVVDAIPSGASWGN